MRALILSTLTLMLLSTVSYSQGLKVGFVQTDVVVQEFPEAVAAGKTFDKEVQSWQNQLNDYKTQLQQMQDEYKQKAMLYSPDKQRAKQEEMSNKNAVAMKMYQDVFGQGGKAEQRKMELMQPINAKIMLSIQTLGKRDNFDMILNAQGALYIKNGMDVTDKVLEILKAGVAVPPSPAGKGAAGAGAGPRR